ncbi:hypothetical protein [Neorhizobium galegae]|uniref:hypothetical protein n=1 Tax=Neorhizobium galegae TaxID=399 RepID=UPI00203506A5|nr:hypothetical protein [Neorhizobium galegae]MCM2496754.1 hypothetical protein [Neorhizobium galegae]
MLEVTSGGDFWIVAVEPAKWAIAGRAASVIEEPTFMFEVTPSKNRANQLDQTNDGKLLRRRALLQAYGCKSYGHLLKSRGRVERVGVA